MKRLLYWLREIDHSLSFSRVGLSLHLALSVIVSAPLIESVFYNFPYYNYVDEGHVVSHIGSGIVSSAPVNIFYGPTFLNLVFLSSLALAAVSPTLSAIDFIELVRNYEPLFYQDFQPAWVLGVGRSISLLAFVGTLLVAARIITLLTGRFFRSLVLIAVIGSLDWYREFAVLAMPEITSIFFLTLTFYLSVRYQIAGNQRLAILLGISMALLAGTKIHYLAFLPVMAAPFLRLLFAKRRANSSRIPKRLKTDFSLVLISFSSLTLVMYLVQDSLPTHIRRVAYMTSYYSEKASSTGLPAQIFLERLDLAWLALCAAAVVLSFFGSLRMIRLSMLVSMCVQFMFFSAQEFTPDRNVIAIPLVIVLLLLTVRPEVRETKKVRRVKAKSLESALSGIVIGIGLLPALTSLPLHSATLELDSRLLLSDFLVETELECQTLRVDLSIQFLDSGVLPCARIEYFPHGELGMELGTLQPGDIVLVADAVELSSGDVEKAAIEDLSMFGEFNLIAEFVGRTPSPVLNHFNRNPYILVVVPNQ